MATTFSQMQLAMQEALERSNAARKRMEQGIQQINQAKVDIDFLTAEPWPSLMAELDARAAAEPANMAIQIAKAQKDEMLSDHAELKGIIDTLAAAVAG